MKNSSSLKCPSYRQRFHLVWEWETGLQIVQSTPWFQWTDPRKTLCIIQTEFSTWWIVMHWLNSGSTSKVKAALTLAQWTRGVPEKSFGLILFIFSGPAPAAHDKGGMVHLGHRDDADESGLREYHKAWFFWPSCWDLKWTQPCHSPHASLQSSSLTPPSTTSKRYNHWLPRPWRATPLTT